MKHKEYLEMLIGPLANEGGGGGGDEPTGSVTLTANGTYNVKTKAQAIVAVPPYGEGSVNINSNGTHNVSGKAQAVVAVPGPSGSMNITENGTYDVTDKAEAVVNVSGGGGSGDVNDYAHDYLQAGFTGELKDPTDPTATKVTLVKQYGLREATGLTGVDLRYCTQLDTYAFYGCPAITKVNLPACTKIGQYCLQNSIKAITEINLPSVESIGSYALSGSNAQDANAIVPKLYLPAMKSQAGGFQRWTGLKAVRMGSSVTSFANGAFRYCSALRTVMFGASLAAVPALGSANDFGSTALGSTSAKILVPSALVEDFKAATRWSTWASHIFAIEDIPAWTAGSYAQGDVVTHGGHYFVCTASTTTEEPSASATDWLDLGAI